MLTRRFGKEVVNYYCGSCVNRYSFLRADGVFLRRAAVAPLTRYVALSGLNPLTNAAGTHLTRFTLKDVSPLTGEQPFAVSEDEAVKKWDSTKKQPLIVFLGVVEEKDSESIESSEHGVVHGNPIFAVDVTPREPFEKAAEEFLENHVKNGGQLQKNPRAMTLEAHDGERPLPRLCATRIETWDDH
jgi:NAD+ diphosphatase